MGGYHSRPMETLLVTGGAGFIGSNFVRLVLATSDRPVVILDKLTYAGNLDNLADLLGDPRLSFVQEDIADREAVRDVFAEHRPGAVVNFAAESHVDRSIDDPSAFVTTNVLGTFELLEAARRFLDEDPTRKARFRFLHVSTDEVYGSLGDDRFVQGDHRLRPQLPLRGVQGGRRPPGARLLRDLPAAGAGDQLLEQLRALPVPGKAHPADDPERPRGPRPAGLRRRLERARLDLRRGPLPRRAAGARGGPAGREVQPGRPERADQPRDRPPAVRPARGAAPGGRQPGARRSAASAPTGSW